MDRYFAKIPRTSVGSTTTSSVASPDPNLNPIIDNVELNSNDIVSDPGRRNNVELLSCIACLSPRSSFTSFNVDKLVHLAYLYPNDFNLTELLFIRQELETYIQDLRKDARFKYLDDLGNLGKKLVETMKHKCFPLVYRLIELALILPVATASVERVFSAMNVVKTRLRNKMGDEWMNDCLVVYIEREVFMVIDDETILQRFQNMENRRCQLSRVN